MMFRCTYSFLYALFFFCPTVWGAPLTGKDGEAFCFRSDGTILSHQDELLIGRSVRDLVDADGMEYGEAFFETAMNGQQEGYAHSSVERLLTGNVHQKLSFVQIYPDWGWVLGTSMFMDAMEQTIAAETETYQGISFENVFIFNGGSRLAPPVLFCHV